MTSGEGLFKPGFLLLLATCTLLRTDMQLTNGLPVRLVNGSTPYSGRLEVLYNSTWGTVCDDKVNSTVCRLVCKQLGHGGGECVSSLNLNNDCLQKSSVHFQDGVGQIWLDDVTCFGYESMLNECLSNNYGKHNCKHTEDVGCICEKTEQYDRGDAQSEQSTAAVQQNGCNQSQHAILPTDSVIPGVGIVLVRDERGRWGLVCDDYWDDKDAAVFCSCLGYTDRTAFRAMLSTTVPAAAKSYPILYDAVHCDDADDTGAHSLRDLNRSATRNIWDCPVKPAVRGKCNPSAEAAAVACVMMDEPKHNKVFCDGRTMTVCVSDATVSQPAPACTRMVPAPLGMKGSALPDFLEEVPRHSSGIPSQDKISSTRWICYALDLATCPLVQITLNATFKHYCYNMSYHTLTLSPSSSSSSSLLDPMTSLRACCTVPLSGYVNASFVSAQRAPAEIHAAAPINYVINCYADSTFSGAAFTFPVRLSRSSLIYCRVNTTLFDPRLALVVPDCRFYAPTDPTISYDFIKNKCAASPHLMTHFFSFDRQSWGFSFLLPKVESSNELYLSCDTYLCDTESAGVGSNKRRDCDRSCQDDAIRSGDGKRPILSRRRRVSHLDESQKDNTITSGYHGRRTVELFNIESVMFKNIPLALVEKPFPFGGLGGADSPVARSTSDERIWKRAAGYDAGNDGGARGGPIIVVDNGYGPLITRNGHLILVSSSSNVSYLQSWRALVVVASSTHFWFFVFYWIRI